MTGQGVVLELGRLHGSGHGLGLSHVLSTLAHAALWSTIGRLIWHAPALVVLVAFVAAAFYLLRGRSARRRGSADRSE